MNHKRVYRLYRDDGLSLRLKRPRRNVSAANRERQPAASSPNEMWSMDFVSDALFDGRRLRALTVVDAFTREALDDRRRPGDQGRAGCCDDDADHVDAGRAKDDQGRQWP